MMIKLGDCRITIVMIFILWYEKKRKEIQIFISECYDLVLIFSHIDFYIMFLRFIRTDNDILISLYHWWSIDFPKDIRHSSGEDFLW